MRYILALLVALIPCAVRAQPALQTQTQPFNDNSTYAASTAFVQRAVVSRNGAGYIPAATMAEISSNTGSTNVTSYVQQVIDELNNYNSQNNGGIVEFPPGTYLICNLSITRNITLRAATFGTVFKANPNCPTGVLVSQNAWRDIRRILYSSTAAQPTKIVVVEAAGVNAVPAPSAGQPDLASVVLVQDDTKVFQARRARVLQTNTPSTGLNTITLDAALPTSSAGNAWRNISDPAVTNIALEGIRVDGNRANQPSEYRNVYFSTSAPNAGNLTLNGSLVPTGQSTAYFTPNSNLFVRICTTAAEPNRSVYITGKKSLWDYTKVDDNVTVNLPKIANSCVTAPYNKRFNQITGITLQQTGALSGNLYVGVSDGNASYNCVTFSAPFFRIRDSQFTNCRGWAFRSDWTAGGGGFNSSYAAQQAYINQLDLDITDQGLLWFNGPNDSKLFGINGGFNLNEGIWLDRNAAGTILTTGHISGGNDGDNFKQPAFGITVDCDSCSITDMLSEEAYVAQLLIRANNINVRGGRYFAPQITTFVQQSSCIQIGDVDYNILPGPLAYYISTRGSECGYAGINFARDGGWGYAQMLGVGFQTTLRATASAGSNKIKLACYGCSNYLNVGFNVIVQLDSGAQAVYLQSYDSVNGEWTISSQLSGNASAGKKIYREYSVAGSPNADAGTRSDIQVYMPEGAYPPSFSQSR